MSLRIVPEDEHLTDAQNLQFGPAAPSAPGLVDTLRSGEPPLSVSSKVNERHPLQTRLEKWDDTRRETQMEMYRRLFGSADPIRREMELQIVNDTDFRPQILGAGITSPSKDILLNRETSIGWEDIYGGFDDRQPLDFHTEMERKMGI